MSPAVRLGAISAIDGRSSSRGLDPSELNWLTALDKGAHTQRNIDAVRRLGDAWLEDKIGNQPIRSNRNFECEIGHDKFSEAAKAWRALAGEPAVPQHAAPPTAPPAAA
jgi:hypothetical protein